MLDWSQIVSHRLGEDPLKAFPARIKIPRPPRSVAEFVQIVERPDVSITKLATIIEKDVELTSHVLRLVNASTLMLRKKISSIQHAISLLGLRRCKMLVMSAALHASFQSQMKSGATVEMILAEAQERAVFGVKVAELLKVDADHVYVASLLQDLLLYHLLDQFTDTYNGYDHHGESLVDFERTEFGWDHAIMVGQLLRSWNFADEVVACACYHHDHNVILEDHELLHSAMGAVALSSLVPSSYIQEPDCIARFMEYQNRIDNFDFLQIAAEVDQELDADQSSRSDRVSLVDRLERLALVAVQGRRPESSWVEKQLGSYTLEEEIGRGGMGIVYRARHTMLRRPAAVKMMRTSKVSRESLDRFHDEVRITSELSSPHTVQVYDYGVTPDGNLYYVMEYLDGLSLSNLVEEFGPLPESRIIHILCQVCGSLAEAHMKGLIHRDIKPENIALTTCAGAYDFAKVLDFGLVSVLGDQDPDAGPTTVIGTPSYMSPESIQFPESVDERTDIYALGAVAFYLATGKVLFGDLPMRAIIRSQVEKKPPSLNEFSDVEATEEFEAVIKSCLAKDPFQRPQNVVELARSLSILPAANDWTFSHATRWWAKNGGSSISKTRCRTRPLAANSFAPTRFGTKSGPSDVEKVDDIAKVESVEDVQNIQNMPTTIINQ